MNERIYKDDTLTITVESHTIMSDGKKYLIMRCPYCKITCFRPAKNQEWTLTSCYGCIKRFWYKKNGHAEKHYSYLNLPPKK